MNKFSKPSPALAQLNEQQKNDQKDFQKRMDPFGKELKILVDKYKINIVGAMDYRQNGTFPILAFIDVKKQMEQMAKQQPEKATDGGEKESGGLILP